MQNDKGICMLNISATIMGKTETIHPTLLWDEKDLLLVDTAYPGQFPLLKKEIANTGLSIENVSKVMISHQDLDHIGGLPETIVNSVHPVEVMASSVEKPYIEGEKKLVKLTPEAIAQALNALPEEIPEQWKLAFKHTLENPPKGKVNTTLEHEEELPLCGGIVIIHTPGHTPGHLSFYHKPSKTLIAADALVVEDGQLFGPDAQVSCDIKMAKKSLERLLHYDIQKIICYHGGLFQGPCNERIAELAKS